MSPARGSLEETESVAASRGRSLEQLTAGMADLQKRILAEEKSIAPLEDRLQECVKAIDDARKGRLTSGEDLAKSDARLEAVRAGHDTAMQKKSGIEVSLAESRMRKENVLERLALEYGIAGDEIVDQPDPEWKDGEPDAEWVDTRIAELRTRLEAMGPVNLVAIDEYQDLQERYDFLTQQQDDLVKSRQKLVSVINKINNTTSEMFQKTFVKINENFNNVFKQLFNGGSAKLVLVNDEDMLESGIEIIARPPGKKLQSVSLLSGGERTLTAVSLLFAIYMTKPSPFCVLDELDAPLDDSNIGRFIDCLKGFLGQSQFLIITHNQQTISAANTLYGVTMEERGVSKIVSVRFVDDAAGPSPDENVPAESAT